MSRIQLSRVTHTNKSCHTYKWVTSHTQMGRVFGVNCVSHVRDTHQAHTKYVTHKTTRSMSSVTHRIESCHIYQRLRKWVMAHIQSMSHTRLHGQCLPSHIELSHVTHINVFQNESCHTYKVCHTQDYTDLWNSRHGFYRALLRNIVSFIGLFCNRDLDFFCMTYTCHTQGYTDHVCYGLATISRLLKIVGLFCRIPSLLWGYSQKRPIILRSPLIVVTPYFTVCYGVALVSRID